MARERLLRYAAALYVIGLAAHTADHVRRGVDVITPYVFWAGILSTALGLLTAVLVFSRHRLAPLAAAAVGVPIAVGVAAVHLLPHWSALSDPFVGGGATGITAESWTVVLLEIAGALSMGLVGLAMVWARRAAAAPLRPPLGADPAPGR